MNERPKDIAEALTIYRNALDIGTGPVWVCRRSDVLTLLDDAIREIKTLKEQYAVQNDSYSRLYKQVYGRD